MQWAPTSACERTRETGAWGGGGWGGVQSQERGSAPAQRCTLLPAPNQPRSALGRCGKDREKEKEIFLPLLAAPAA